CLGDDHAETLAAVLIRALTDQPTRSPRLGSRGAPSPLEPRTGVLAGSSSPPDALDDCEWVDVSLSTSTQEPSGSGQAAERHSLASSAGRGVVAPGAPAQGAARGIWPPRATEPGSRAEPRSN